LKVEVKRHSENICRDYMVPIGSDGIALYSTVLFCPSLMYQYQVVAKRKLTEDRPTSESQWYWCVV